MTAPARPTVEGVLAAIGRSQLSYLCPADQSRQLAAFVARVESGLELTIEQQREAARLIQANRRWLEGPLAHLGIEIPPEPEPVERAAATSAAARRAGRPSQLWVRSDGKIGIRSPFALKDLVKGLPGAGRDRAWNGGEGCWTVPATPVSAANVLALLEPHGYQAREGVLALARTHAEASDARALLDESTPAPDNDGTDVVTMPLWTHQRRAVAHAEQAPAVVWAIKMGGGKTGAAIAAVNRVQARTVLIVCPNRVRAVWPREVRERSAIGWHIEDGTRAPKRKGARRQDLPQPERLARMQALLWDCQCGASVHAFVINYEAMTQQAWQNWAPPHKLDMIIYDEAHNLKAHQTKIPPKRVKGVNERNLLPGASEAEVKEARRLDNIGPLEAALPDTATATERRLAKQRDRVEKRKADVERANRLTRSGVAARWVQWSHRRIALTGTPLPQHPWDIFGLYRAIDPGVFGTVWKAFQDRYLVMAKGGQFPVKVKSEMMAELGTKAMELMYRPRVDLNLPGVSDVVRVVELEDDARRAYDEMDSQLWTDLTRFARQRAEHGPGGAGAFDGETLDSIGDMALEIDGETVPFDPSDTEGSPLELTAQNILTRLLRLQQLTGGTLRPNPERVMTPTGWRLQPSPEVRVSTAKAEMLEQVLDELGCEVVKPRAGQPAPPPPEPVVVFTRFTSDLDAVRAIAAKRGLRYGEVSGRRSDGLNADGRMSEDVDLVGVNIRAGGTGVDMTRSRYVVWYSLGYSVSDYDQARARNYRPGQTRPVVNVHIIAADTKDQEVYDAIKARRDAVAAVLVAGGVDPEEVGVTGESVGPDPNAARVDGQDSTGAAVTLPWDDA
jgi:hypothetical protein